MTGEDDTSNTRGNQNRAANIREAREDAKRPIIPREMMRVSGTSPQNRRRCHQKQERALTFGFSLVSGRSLTANESASSTACSTSSCLNSLALAPLLPAAALDFFGILWQCGCVAGQGGAGQSADAEGNR